MFAIYHNLVDKLTWDLDFEFPRRKQLNNVGSTSEVDTVYKTRKSISIRLKEPELNDSGKSRRSLLHDYAKILGDDAESSKTKDDE